MQIILKPTPLLLIWETRTIDFVEMMKIVVDVRQEILAIDADMHADLETLLLENGSQQQDLWGANIYPLKDPDDQIEFTSFINIRPSQGNRGMEVKDISTRELIRSITGKLLVKS